MNIFVILICFNFFIGITIYGVLFRKRVLFSERFGMIMAMSSSGILSLTIAMILHFLFPINVFVIFLASAAVGALFGLLFGSLVSFQSLLSGFSHGVIGSMMGTMLGAVIQNPALCGLPSTQFSAEQNMIIFSLFGTSLVIITLCLVYYSLRV